MNEDLFSLSRGRKDARDSSSLVMGYMKGNGEKSRKTISREVEGKAKVIEHNIENTSENQALKLRKRGKT